MKRQAAAIVLTLSLALSANAQGSRFDNAQAAVQGQQIGVGVTPDGHTKAGKAFWFCDAFTKTGKRCRRHVVEAGLVCAQHRSKN